MADRLNFTQYLEATEGVEPEYTIEGETPKCPRGYKWNMKSKRCEPKSEQDRVSDGHKKDFEPRNAPGYNVWGHTGVNGDGYAWAEPNNWGDSSASGSGGGVV